MKLSRNVLVGSLATVGMVLGAVAPAVTAQAAKTSGVVDADGNVTKSTTTDASGMEEAGQLGKGNLAIAYDKDGTGTETGTAEAYSNAAVQVINGVLVLDKVPDFNFGAAAQKTTKALQDNTKHEGNYEATDGNDEGVLQVTESRSKAPGFTLQAKLADFVNADGSKITKGGLGGDFELNLEAAPLTLNDEAYTNGNIPYTTLAQNLKAGGDAATVMSQAGKVGTFAAKFNTADLASLYVGDMGKTDADSPSVQSVHSTVTWTLNAKATATPSTPEA